MTWLKVSDDFPDQCADLSDAAYRTHTEGLCWCMRRETGGYLSRRDVRRMAESEWADEAVQELLDAGFWVAEGEGYRIKHHMEHQPSPETVERQRRSQRLRSDVSRSRAEIWAALQARSDVLECAHCGDRNVDRLTIDHIVPLRRGGTNHMSNLQVLCSICNSIKGDT